VIAPERTSDPSEIDERDRPWSVMVWNDPVTLMSYVVFVLRKLFNHDEATATKLMLRVHNEGRAVVASGTREKSEADVARLHAHGLQATLSQD
jgi:ATP-dependent Clp protease adaptor protein ClpS